MEFKGLDEMLTVLRKHGVSAFRHKSETDFVEVVLTPGDGLVTTEEEDDDEESMEDVSPYSASNVGITIRSFEEDARIAESHRKNIIKDI